MKKQAQPKVEEVLETEVSPEKVQEDYIKLEKDRYGMYHYVSIDPEYDVPEMLKGTFLTHSAAVRALLGA